MTNVDATTIKFWELAGAWGFIFVWVGVAGQGLEIFAKLFAPLWHKEREHFFAVFGAVFWTILVAALAVEFFGGIKVTEIAAGQNAKLNAVAAEARKETGLAFEQAAQNDEKRVEAENQAEELLSSNIVLSIELEKLRRAKAMAAQ